MIKRWHKLMATYDALQPRERLLIALALLGGIVLIGFTLLVEPAQKRSARAVADIREQKQQLQEMTRQMAVLQARQLDPVAETRRELQGLQAQLAAQGERMATFESRLVRPQQMASLLEDLVGRQPGLRLLRLKTLPAAPVVEKKLEVAAAEGAAAAPAEEKKAVSALWRHGVEITLEGDYSALVAYLEQLERAGSKLLWQQVSLSADKHPHLVLTLTVFTLSLDRSWLIV